MQRWFWLFILACGLTAGINLIVDGSAWLGGIIIAGAAAIAWWMFPLRGGRSLTHQQVQALPAAERTVVVYWRPGCQFCSRLNSALGPLRNRAHWINIWRDADAASYVRGVNEGNETVPTVVIDGTPVTNPPHSMVKARLTEPG